MTDWERSQLLQLLSESYPRFNWAKLIETTPPAKVDRQLPRIGNRQNCEFRDDRASPLRDAKAAVPLDDWVSRTPICGQLTDSDRRHINLLVSGYRRFYDRLGLVESFEHWTINPLTEQYRWLMLVRGVAFWINNSRDHSRLTWHRLFKAARRSLAKWEAR